MPRIEPVTVGWRAVHRSDRSRGNGDSFVRSATRSSTDSGVRGGNWRFSSTNASSVSGSMLRATPASSRSFGNRLSRRSPPSR